MGSKQISAAHFLFSSDLSSTQWNTSYKLLMHPHQLSPSQKEAEDLPTCVTQYSKRLQRNSSSMQIAFTPG